MAQPLQLFVLKRRLRLSGLLGILVAAMGGGCGGEDQALSRDEYVARLNAMCEDFAAREQRIGEPQSVSDLVEKGPQILDAFEDAIADEIDGLEAPDEIAAEANRLAELADEQRVVLGDLVEAAQNDDFLAVRTLASENLALNNESNSIARELGAKSCAGG